MLKVLFRDIMNGHLTRLSYFGYSLLLVLLVVVLGIAFALTMLIIGNLIIGDNHQGQDMLRQWLSLPGFITIGLCVFGWSNITAKRIRDTGLPGWWTLLAITILQSTLFFTVSVPASSSLQTLFEVALLSIPTNAFIKN